MKQEPISCRADNALAARCQSFAARWACVLKRPILYLAAYIDNNTPYYISFPRLNVNVIFKWFITNENYRSANNRFRMKFGLVVWSYRVKRVSSSTKKCQPLIESYRFVLDSKWSPIKKNFCAVLGILGVFHENKRKPEGFGIKRQQDSKVITFEESKSLAGISTLF